MQLIKPSPEFEQLTPEEVKAALASREAGKPISKEIERLMDGYWLALVGDNGRPEDVPATTLRKAEENAKSPIEKTALRLTFETMREVIKGRL